MSLIENMMEKCVIMNSAKVSDGEGGFIVEWSEGAEIDVAIVNNSSMEARIAEKQGVTSTYTLTTTKGVKLEYHDVIKRVSDGKIFRVTTEYGDTLSPNVSTLDISQVSAEKWSLTS